MPNIINNCSSLPIAMMHEDKEEDEEPKLDGDETVISVHVRQEEPTNTITKETWTALGRAHTSAT